MKSSGCKFAFPPKIGLFVVALIVWLNEKSYAFGPKASLWRILQNVQKDTGKNKQPIKNKKDDGISNEISYLITAECVNEVRNLAQLVLGMQKNCFSGKWL